MFGNNYYQQPMNGLQGYSNPYQARLDSLQSMQNQQMMGQMQSYNIIHVNGQNGANAFRMAPNSQCLLLDDTAPIVWLCVSDGAGYHTVTPYSIAPYQAQPEPDYKSLNDRITRLEGILNGQPNASNAEQTNAKSPANAKPANAQ